ncbi:hypothetical protein [Amycolatopsis sp. H20-H5]|uniref:hypothetical protein n=1 Tax=Amycolatopsis sp. H20-H5 TaxID=3046309 RepID=UPI002DC04057|nr:hypothetical protein [Amycolatopsis sp. H20-H5]MEC3977886.1 hypothetical protein [Amycolatopsis sp. H20-H5]
MSIAMPESTSGGQGRHDDPSEPTPLGVVIHVLASKELYRRAFGVLVFVAGFLLVAVVVLRVCGVTMGNVIELFKAIRGAR